MWESGQRAHPADHPLRKKTQTNMKFDILTSVLINIAVLWALRTCNVEHTEVQVVCWLTHTAPHNRSPVTQHDGDWWVKWAHLAMPIQCSWVKEQPQPKFKKIIKWQQHDHMWMFNVRKHNVLQLCSNWLTRTFGLANPSCSEWPNPAPGTLCVVSAYIGLTSEYTLKQTTCFILFNGPSSGLAIM
jgi:hypothetical protein